jgi:hypothetical protein
MATDLEQMVERLIADAGEEATFSLKRVAAGSWEAMLGNTGGGEAEFKAHAKTPDGAVAALLDLMNHQWTRAGDGLPADGIPVLGLTGSDVRAVTLKGGQPNDGGEVSHWAPLPDEGRPAP